MNSSKKTSLLVTHSLIYCLISGCSTASVRVLPGEDIHRVVVRDIERDDAEEEAAKAANEYCEKQGKRAVIVADNTKYTGEMDESTRDTIRKGSKAAMILGGARGGAAGTAGSVGYSVTSDRDYLAELRFRCR